MLPQYFALLSFLRPPKYIQKNCYLRQENGLWHKQSSLETVDNHQPVAPFLCLDLHPVFCFLVKLEMAEKAANADRFFSLWSYF